jgi:UDP-GlcNAc:undecaprenyl-phosphate GlcNAc-1-phosphate transferase
MWPFLFTALLAGGITPGIIWFYQKQKWVEDPKKSKHVKVIHDRPVPRGGGMVIFLSVLMSSLVFLHPDKYLISILLGALVLAVLGFIDDIYDIHPFIRLIGGFVAAMIVVSAGIGIAYITNPLGSGVIYLNQPQVVLNLFGKIRTIWVIADILAILFIVWNMNIVNWSKGLDGQMPGFVSIAAVFIGLLSYRFIDDPSQFNTAHLAFIIAGAFAGFLLWNFYPQKIMAGYGAGSLAGYFLAILAILSGAKVATTLMVLAVPTADAVFTVGRRLVAGKSPFWGDRGHLHHKLMDVLGWGKRRIALFYWASTFIMGWLSLYLNTVGKIVTMAVTTSIVFGFLIWAKLYSSKKKSQEVYE